MLSFFMQIKKVNYRSVYYHTKEGKHYQMKLQCCLRDSNYSLWEKNEHDSISHYYHLYTSKYYRIYYIQQVFKNIQHC